MLKDLIKGFKNYFNFTRTETRGFYALGFILLLIILLPFFAEWILPESRLVSKEDYQKLDSLVNVIEERNKVILFEFNPNKISQDSLELLKIDDFVISNWINYRSAGGIFQVKSDVQKIYGFSDEKFAQIKPYILLPDSVKRIHSVEVNLEEKKIRETEKPLRPEPKHFDINTTTAEELKSINGIGEVLSVRIIKYRDLLGGFIGQDQFEEVYNLSEEAYNNLKEFTYIDESFRPERININEAEYIEILRHPYISKELTNKIFDERNSEDVILTKEKFAELVGNDSEFMNLLPYIEF